MRYLLDTDVLIYWLKGDQLIEAKALNAGLDNLGFSIISFAELCFGAHNSDRVRRNLDNIQKLRGTIALLPLDEDSAQRFGAIKSELKSLGRPLPDADLLIAATAIAEDIALVTNNRRHFRRVPGLDVESWTT